MTGQPTPTPPPSRTTASEAVAANVADLRDQILGPPRPAEDLEDFRLRSYQVLRTARELVTVEPSISSGTDPAEPTDPDDPLLASYHSKLDLIATTLNHPLDH